MLHSSVFCALTSSSVVYLLQISTSSIVGSGRVLSCIYNEVTVPRTSAVHVLNTPHIAFNMYKCNLQGSVTTRFGEPVLKTFTGNGRSL